MTPARIEPEVYEDLAEATDWYDTEQPGVGARFLLTMHDLMNAVEEAPQTFPVESGRVRVAWRKPFPYKMYFLLAQDTVRIFAVIHTSRHPDTWRARRAAEEE